MSNIETTQPTYTPGEYQSHWTWVCHYHVGERMTALTVYDTHHTDDQGVRRFEFWYGKRKYSNINQFTVERLLGQVMFKGKRISL